MSNHTNGPWYVEEQNYDASSYYIRGTDSKGNRLTWGKGSVAHIPRSTVMPMEANANLIASAPELLDALIDCVSLMSACWDETNPETIKARAAIKKATGG